ncbi:hypothetical protein [Streptomyces sp. NPDC002426]
MSKGGRARKKSALPPSGAVQGKRVGRVGSLLPGAATSDDRVCWRFAHVERWRAILDEQGRPLG